MMIGLSSITYGIFSISIYLFLQGLNVKLDWFMTIFILFQISALRTTWDLQKDILALSFTFFIFYLILRDRKLPSSYHKKEKIIHFSNLISLFRNSPYKITLYTYHLSGNFKDSKHFFCKISIAYKIIFNININYNYIPFLKDYR
jgi:hypothetical protein